MSKLANFVVNAGRPVAYYPSLGKKIGICEAIILQQFLYWTDKCRDPNGWIYKSSDELESETGMTYKVQFRAREKLKQLGLIQEKTSRLEHKIFFRVNTLEIEAMFEDIAAIPNVLPQPPDGVLAKRPTGVSGNAQRDVGQPTNGGFDKTETTTETTSEITSDTLGVDGKEAEPNPTIQPKPPQSKVEHAKKDFVAPTWLEVRQYCNEAKLRHIDPDKFVRYYGAMAWHDKDGKAVKCWKGKCRTWNARAIMDGKQPIWFHGVPPKPIDPTPDYTEENERFWISGKGYFAEFMERKEDKQSHWDWLQLPNPFAPKP